MTFGQPYDPKRLFYGIFIPEWLLCRKEISLGAKCAFGVLNRHSENGTCARTGKDLSAEVGVSEKTWREYVKELVDQNLLLPNRPGLGLPNTYTFQWHPWVEERPIRATVPERNPSTEQERNPSTEPRARDPNPFSPKREETREETTAPAHMHGDTSHEQQAVVLYHNGGEDTVYAWSGLVLNGRTWEEWKTQVGAHFQHGRVVTVEHLQAASTRARADYEAKGSQGPRRMGWYYTALAAVLNGDPPKNGKRNETPDEAAKRIVSERRARLEREGKR